MHYPIFLHGSQPDPSVRFRVASGRFPGRAVSGRFGVGKRKSKTTHVWWIPKRDFCLQGRGWLPRHFRSAWTIGFSEVDSNISRAVDNTGARCKLECVNWYGASNELYVVEGMHKRTMNELVDTMVTWGFNCVRLPFSLEVI